MIVFESFGYFFLKKGLKYPMYLNIFLSRNNNKKKFAILISMLQFDNALEHNDHSLSSFCVKNRLVQ